jgi:hypothetical protein
MRTILRQPSCGAALGSEMIQERHGLFEMRFCLKQGRCWQPSVDGRTRKTVMDGEKIWNAQPCLAIGDLEADEVTTEIY